MQKQPKGTTGLKSTENSLVSYDVSGISNQGHLGNFYFRLLGNRMHSLQAVEIQLGESGRAIRDEIRSLALDIARSQILGHPKEHIWSTVKGTDVGIEKEVHARDVTLWHVHLLTIVDKRKGSGQSLPSEAFLIKGCVNMNVLEQVKWNLRCKYKYRIVSRCERCRE